ncbi:MAG: methionine--tRNA ligase subunit beta [Candidatus Acidiferrales bacterium]
MVPEQSVAVRPLKANAIHIVGAAKRHYDGFRFSESLQEVWQLVSLVDFMLVAEKPWKLAADSQQLPAVGAVLYEAAETLRIAAVLAHPVLPDATQKIWEQLGQSGKIEKVSINDLQWGALKPGTRIGKPEGVFPRADKKEILERIETMENEIRNPGSAQPTPSADSAPTAPIIAAVSGATAAPAASPKISIEDFAKVELRAGIVKSAERIQGADKLLKLLVDIGDEVRQVLAGIALSYAPEDLVGRKVVIVTNLAPRKMRGLESNGMLLAASVGPDGKPVLCTFAEDVPAGAKVK